MNDAINWFELPTLTWPGPRRSTRSLLGTTRGTKKKPPFHGDLPPEERLGRLSKTPAQAHRDGALIT